ncbi:MAG: tRNA glutamyl-Q(34) synthetase GluQRS [Deltaproteobacteria bacterium]|nr:tRNA glutamyl-Q(34) synthetase GluQRS [Deltaproteobacteria bacterium]
MLNLKLHPPPQERGYVGRYAPSPSGNLHLGNLFAAVVAYAQARRHSGHIFLRMEDTDHPRCKKEYAENIIRDLYTLGFRFDAGPGFGTSLPSGDVEIGPYTQSERLPIYHAALEVLLKKDLLYRCCCSRKGIQQAASAPHAGEEGPIYTGTCRGVAVDEDAPYAVRLKVPVKKVCIEDRWAGVCCQELQKDVGDFVLLRKDDVIAYHLAVVVDDALQGVTEVVRGRDLFTSSPRQAVLFEMFDFPLPSFAHAPLWVDSDGQRLAKRRGDRTLRALLAEESPMQILGRVGDALGLCEVGEPLSLEHLMERLLDAGDSVLRAETVR